MKRFLCALMALALIGSSQAFASAPTDEMQLSASRLSSEVATGHIGYLAFPRSSGLDVRDSFLLGMKLNNADRPTEVKLCASLEDISCRELTDFTIAAVLPNCSTEIKENCVEAFFAMGADGKRFDVISQGLFTNEIHNRFTGDQSLGIPTGSSPTLYRIPSAPHEAGDLYLPLVTRSGSWTRGNSKMTNFDNTSISLYAVKITDGSYSLLTPSVAAADYEVKNQINTFGTDSNCIYNDSDSCAVAYPLPRNVTFGFTVNYSVLQQNWFHGRVEKPEVQISGGESGGIRVTVSGKAVDSSGFFALKKRTDLPAAITAAHDQKIGKGVCTGSDVDSSCYDSNLWQTKKEMDVFLEWLEVAGDRASFNPTIWTINVMNQGLEHPRAAQCATAAASLVGLVSTNATQYIAGPPVFNPATNELEYKVAAPHLRSDGSIFRGTYDLAINGDYARCLYGFTGSVVKASISVTSDNGALVAASASQSERDGWLYLTAQNFTFSSPTIKVKLVQQETSKPPKDLKPLAGTKGTKTISCVKGSKTKSVNAKIPKCPKGYKRV